MGYAADYFQVHVARWLDEGWLFPGARLIEFGAQEFNCDLGEARKHTSAFLLDRSSTRLDDVLSIASVYRAVGVDYTSIDVDGSWGSTFFDLNTFAPPPEWTAAYDMVNNEGTIEHLANPVNGFQVAHELLKVGGLARHSIPLTGWPEHGLLYPTKKFYDLLIWENGYEVLEQRADNEDQASRWLHLTYRKRSDRAFRVPFDHLTRPNASAIGARLTNNWRVFAQRRFNGDHPTRAPMSLWQRLVSVKRRIESLVS
jgi:SAM-dependent methyltransferase